MRMFYIIFAFLLFEHILPKRTYLLMIPVSQRNLFSSFIRSVFLNRELLGAIYLGNFFVVAI